jgi:hypothetical protein
MDSVVEKIVAACDPDVVLELPALMIRDVYPDAERFLFVVAERLAPPQDGVEIMFTRRARFLGAREGSFAQIARDFGDRLYERSV